MLASSCAICCGDDAAIRPPAAPGRGRADQCNVSAPKQAITPGTGGPVVAFGCRQAKFAEDAGDVFLDRAEGEDEGGRDAGIAEFLQFLSSWLRRDTRRLGASLASFTGHPPTDTALTRAAAPCSRAGHDRETPYQRRAEEIFSASV